jgi:hypothetical protein
MCLEPSAMFNPQLSMLQNGLNRFFEKRSSLDSICPSAAGRLVHKYDKHIESTD